MVPIPIERVSRHLGGSRVLGHALVTVADLRREVSVGLPVESLLEAFSGFSPEERSLLVHRVVPRSTLSRRKGRLRPEESERLERVVRVISMAEEIWQGDPESARTFLLKKHVELGGEAPLETAYSELGARAVEELLMKIRYGLAV